jgi:plasmid stabilization system protein ParE
MKVIYTKTAARQIESQIAYLISQHAEAAALRARARIESFVTDFLARHPRAGTQIPEKGIFEAWIPRTKYVLVYRIEGGDVLRILALFHTSQDRSGFDPPLTD